MAEPRPRRLRFALALLAVLVIGTGGLFFWLLPNIQRRALTSARATVQELYEGAEEGVFGGKAQTPETLEKLHLERGPVMMFQVLDAKTSPWGTPTVVKVRVVRGRKQSVETCILHSSKVVSQIEYDGRIAPDRR